MKVILQKSSRRNLKMSQLKEMIQTKLAEDLEKIDIYEVENHDIILDEKPEIFFADARTIFMDGDNYHVVVLERGVVRFDKVYDSLHELMYELLDWYVMEKANVKRQQFSVQNL